MSLDPAPIKTESVDKQGFLTMPWMRWFGDLYNELKSQIAAIVENTGLSHERRHAITDTSDHTSTATAGKLLKADANGLPVTATNTDAEVQATVSESHERQHTITSTSDHTSAATAGNLLKADANGLPADSIAIESGDSIGVNTTPEANLHVLHDTAQANKHLGVDVGFILEAEESRMQLISEDEQNEGSSIYLSSVPSSGQNKHWFIKHKGPVTYNNRFEIGYALSSASGIPFLNDTPHITILKTGEMGIGVVAPSTKLHVSGYLTLQGNTSSIIANTVDTGRNRLDIKQQSSLANGPAIFLYGSTDSIAPGRITMWAANAQVIDVKSTGELGIGTNTQSAKFAVNGGAHIGGDSDPGDNNLLADGTIESGSTIKAATAFQVGSNQVVGARGSALTAALATLTAQDSPGTPDYLMTVTDSGGAMWETADKAKSFFKWVERLELRLNEIESRLGSSAGHGLIT